MPTLTRLSLVPPLTAAVLLVATPAHAQAPAASGSQLPWQVAVMFTANWVLAAVAVAILSRPSKRPDKPKKPIDEDGD